MWSTIASTVAVGLWCLLCVAATAIRLPGTWAIVACAAVVGWLTGWRDVTAAFVGVLAAVAVAGEVAETLSSAATARKAGASRRAMVGGIVGGFAGALLLSFLVPIPLIGTMVGALVGCFGGAMLSEWSMRGRVRQSAVVGAASAAGFVLGSLVKTSLAVAMSAILIFSIVRGGSMPPPSATVSQPTPQLQQAPKTTSDPQAPP